MSKLLPLTLGSLLSQVDWRMSLLHRNRHAARSLRLYGDSKMLWIMYMPKELSIETCT